MTNDPRKQLIAVIKRAKIGGDAIANADAIIAGLEREGLFIADGDDILGDGTEHLRTLKAMATLLKKAMNDPEIPARDLSSVTNRLIAVSREVTSIEEKLSAEKRTSGQSSSNGAAKTAKTGSAVDI